MLTVLVLGLWIASGWCRFGVFSCRVLPPASGATYIATRHAAVAMWGVLKLAAYPPPGSGGQWRPMGVLDRNQETKWFWGFECYETPAARGPGTILVIPLWLPLVLAGGASVLLWREERARRRVAATACASCGYDRRGLATGAPCPECGSV